MIVACNLDKVVPIPCAAIEFFWTFIIKASKKVICGMISEIKDCLLLSDTVTS